MFVRRFWHTHKFSVNFGKYHTAQVLNYIVKVCSLQDKFCKKPSNYLPQWLCYFVFPLPVNESSFCTISLPMFWILAILIGVQWYVIVILIRNPLRTYNVENIFICLYAIYMSFSVMCPDLQPMFFLGGGVCLFFNLLLSFGSFLYEYDSFFRQHFFMKYVFQKCVPNSQLVFSFS